MADISTTLYMTPAGAKRLHAAWRTLEAANPDLEIGFGDDTNKNSARAAWANVVTRSFERGRTPSLERHVRDVRSVIDAIGMTNFVEAAPARRGLPKPDKS